MMIPKESLVIGNIYYSLHFEYGKPYINKILLNNDCFKFTRDLTLDLKSSDGIKECGYYSLRENLYFFETEEEAIEAIAIHDILE